MCSNYFAVISTNINQHHSRRNRQWPMETHLCFLLEEIVSLRKSSFSIVPKSLTWLRRICTDSQVPGYEYSIRLVKERDCKRATIHGSHHSPWKFQENCRKKGGADSKCYRIYQTRRTYYLRIYDLLGVASWFIRALGVFPCTYPWIIGASLSVDFRPGDRNN